MAKWWRVNDRVYDKLTGKQGTVIAAHGWATFVLFDDEADDGPAAAQIIEAGDLTRAKRRV